MIHEVDALRYLCGEIEDVEAIASSATRGFEVEDTVAVALRFASGALGSFLLSDTAASPASWELTSGENPAYPRVRDADAYLVAGDRGSLAIPTMRLSVYGDAPSWWEPLQRSVLRAPRNDPLAAQLRHFCAVVRDGARPVVDAWDGAQNLLVVESIASAALAGRVVATRGLREAAGATGNRPGPGDA
jgi:predicted dehydrogenase